VLSSQVKKVETGVPRKVSPTRRFSIIKTYSASFSKQTELLKRLIRGVLFVLEVLDQQRQKQAQEWKEQEEDADYY